MDGDFSTPKPYIPIYLTQKTRTNLRGNLRVLADLLVSFLLWDECVGAQGLAHVCQGVAPVSGFKSWDTGK